MESTQCDPEAVEVKKRPRDHVRTSAEEENIVFLAYVCLTLGLSLKEFETMARCVHSLSANTPAAYMSGRSYREITECANACIRETVVAAVKSSPVLTICCDEGVVNSGFFCIRVHYLNDKSESCTHLSHLSGFFFKDLMRFYF